MERRVVITAEALITPVGNTKSGVIDNLINGVSGVKKLREDPLLDKVLKSRVFGTVDYPINYNFKRKYTKTLGPVGFYACQVAKEVLEKSGLDENFISSGRMGVAFGSTQGSPNVQREMFKTFFNDSFELKDLKSAGYIRQMTHTTAVNIARMFSITGRIISSCTACTTSAQSIGYGYEAIKYGLQDAMICGGADEYDTLTVAVFDKLLAASTAYNEAPGKTPRPFDADRDGLVVGEGAGALLLEDYESAKKRGAPILAEVAGFYCGCNGGDLIYPDVERLEQTLRMGLENAGLNPEQVDFISAHATATLIGDTVEAESIYSVYKDRPCVTGFKGFTGHTMGTCGVIEAVFTLYMMQNKIIIPTLNLENVDEGCKMINHTLKLTEKQINIATIQNFAFGGVNTSLFIKMFR